MSDMATCSSTPPHKRPPGRRCLAFIATLLLAAIYCLPASADDSGLVSGARHAGRATGSALHDIGQGAKQVGLEIGHAAADAGRQIGHGAAELGRSIGRAAKEGGREFGHAIKGGA